VDPIFDTILFFIKLNKMEKEVELMKKVSVSQKLRSQAL